MIPTRPTMLKTGMGTTEGNFCGMSWKLSSSLLNDVKTALETEIVDGALALLKERGHVTPDADYDRDAVVTHRAALEGFDRREQRLGLHAALENRSHAQDHAPGQGRGTADRQPHRGGPDADDEDRRVLLDQPGLPLLPGQVRVHVQDLLGVQEGEVITHGA